MNFSIDIKKYIPKIILVFAFSISLFYVSALGQNVTIEDVIQKDQQVYVYYTLEGNSVYDVDLYFVNVKGSEGWKKARVVSGDVGEKQKGGKKTKLIVWDVIADKGELVGKCDFKVTALDTKAQNKSAKYYKKRGKELARSRTPENSFSYLSEPSRQIGLSYSRLNNNNNIGGYFDISIGGRFPYTSYHEIDNYGNDNHPGNAYTNGNVAQGSFKMSGGITHEIPNTALWGYAGIGFVYNSTAEECDVYFSSTGNYWDTTYFKNTDRTGGSIALELGVKVKVDPISIRTGLINSNNENGYSSWGMQFGFGFIFL